MARDAPPLYWCDVTKIISATYCFGAILNRQGGAILSCDSTGLRHVLLQLSAIGGDILNLWLAKCRETNYRLPAH